MHEMLPDELRQLSPIDNPPVNAPFHWRDGWYFQRLKDASVLVTKHGTGARQFVIPSNEWASIVAHVSAAGENGDTWASAVKFHMDVGHRPAPPRTP